MREIFEDNVKEWFPLKHSNLIMKMEDDQGVDDYVKAKSTNTISLQFGRYLLSHSKRLMNDVISKQVVYLIKVFTTLIPILCTYIGNFGLNCLIMDSLKKLWA